MKKIRFKEFMGYSLALFLIIASYIRLYFGVDFQDEAFYVAIPYRFLLGDLPIINEYSICQFAAILLFPFYKLFFSFQHDSQGIMLFSRHLFFIFYALLGYLTYSVLKKEIGKIEALLISCICILYVPYNVLGLSYNTLSMLFFTAGAFFAFSDYQNKFVGKQNLVLAGFFYSLSVFTYPPLIAPALISITIVALMNGFKRTVLNFLLGTLPVIIISLFIVIKFRNDLVNLYYWLQQTGHASHKSLNTTTFLDFFEIFWIFKTIGFFTLGLIIFNLFHYQKISFSNTFLRSIIVGWGYASLLLLPLSAAIFYIAFYLKSHNHFLLYSLLITLSLLAPFYFLLTNKPNFSKKLLLYIWLPSFLSGILTATASGSGFVNSMVGLFPAFLVSSIVVFLAIQKFFQEDLSNSPLKSYLKALPAGCLFVFLLFLVFYKFAIVIRDNSIMSLHSQVTTGPYKFIYTSYQKNLLLEKINEDLTYIIETYHPKNIYVYPRYFGTYLVTNLRPLTNSIWVEQGYDNQPTLNYFKRLNQKPEVAVYFKGLIKDSNDTLVNYLNSDDYLALVSRENYSIYVLNKILP